MSIEKSSYLYEIMVRGNPDGTLAGAHILRIERLIDADTGVVLSERALPAEDLPLEGVAGVVSEATAGLASELAAERAKVTTLEAQLAQARADVGAAQANDQAGAVTDIQIRLALDEMELLDAVESWVGSAPRQVRIWWERALYIARDNPMVEACRAALAASVEDMDRLFALAATK